LSSFFEGVTFFPIFAALNKENAQVAKLVDALLSGSSAVRCAGSNPVLGTDNYKLNNFDLYIDLIQLFSFGAFHRYDQYGANLARY
jgi:hypothetical protein